jgi:Ca-activated chloride channel family protein
MIRFLEPIWLLLLLLVALLATAYVLVQLRRRTYAVRFTNVALLQSIAPRGPGWRRHLGAAVLLLALVVLSTGMAKPAADVKEPQERATVVLALDVSLSMQAQDVSPDRISAAKEAAKQFITELPASYNLGLVSFARNASVVVTPTKEHDQVVAAIDNLELDESTATGEAVFTSLQAIQNVPADGAQGPPPARIVLLSDGFRTIGRTTEEAGEAASAANVPVSTIAFGTDDGVVQLPNQPAAVPVPVDRDSLRKLADQTSGKFYEAASASQLREVYQDLGSSIGYRTVAKEITQWFLGFGLLLALVASGLSLLWTSRLP